MISLRMPFSFDKWRVLARALINSAVAPEDVLWVSQGESSLFKPQELDASAPPFPVPKRFMNLAFRASFHADEKKWELMYRVLWRLMFENKRLLSDISDKDVRGLIALWREVGRDAHRMKGFLRFGELKTEKGDVLVSFYKPKHDVLGFVAPFFARRFPDLFWIILTPHESACWNTKEIIFGKGVPDSPFESKDDVDDLWRVFYWSLFNPERRNERAMMSHMPKCFWECLPELGN